MGLFQTKEKDKWNCEDEPIRTYLRDALRNIVYGANQSNLANFNELNKMSDREVSQIINNFYETKEVKVEESIKNFREMTHLSQIYGRSIVREAMDYFLEQFPSCSAFFSIYTDSTYRVTYNNRDYIVPLQSLHLNDYEFITESILGQLLPKLKLCPKIIIIDIFVNYINKLKGHSNYIIIETENNGGKNRTLNLYIYEPHGKAYDHTYQFALALTKIMKNALKTINPDFNYKFKIFNKTLCPIGIQSIWPKDIGACATISMVTLIIIMQVWTQMYKKGEIYPIHKWGNCVEEFLQYYWTPYQIKLLFLGYITAFNNFFIQEKNKMVKKRFSHIGLRKRNKEISELGKKNLLFTPLPQSDFEQQEKKRLRKKRRTKKRNNLPEDFDSDLDATPE